MFFSAKELIKLMFIIVAYMNDVHNTHLEVIYVMVNLVIIKKFIVYFLMLTNCIVGRHFCV